MKKQLPRSEGFVIHHVAVAVGTDVAVVEEGLSALHSGIAVLQIHMPFSDGLDLGPLEHNPRLEFFFNEIVVVGLTIRHDRFFTFLFLLLRH